MIELTEAESNILFGLVVKHMETDISSKEYDACDNLLYQLLTNDFGE